MGKVVSWHVEYGLPIIALACPDHVVQEDLLVDNEKKHGM